MRGPHGPEQVKSSPGTELASLIALLTLTLTLRIRGWIGTALWRRAYGNLVCRDTM